MLDHEVLPEHYFRRPFRTVRAWDPEDLEPWLGGFPWGSSEPAVRTAQRVKGTEGKARKPPLWKRERQEGQVQRETVPGQAPRN